VTAPPLARRAAEMDASKRRDGQEQRLRGRRKSVAQGDESQKLAALQGGLSHSEQATAAGTVDLALPMERGRARRGGRRDCRFAKRSGTLPGNLLKDLLLSQRGGISRPPKRVKRASTLAIAFASGTALGGRSPWRRTPGSSIPASADRSTTRAVTGSLPISLPRLSVGSRPRRRRGPRDRGSVRERAELCIPQGRAPAAPPRPPAPRRPGESSAARGLDTMARAPACTACLPGW
jgi:hypothetical protein